MCTVRQPQNVFCLIAQDFPEYPEHRTHIFYLLKSVIATRFPAVLAIPPAQFKLVLDSIIWAFKHTMRNVADTGENRNTHNSVLCRTTLVMHSCCF